MRVPRTSLFTKIVLVLIVLVIAGVVLHFISQEREENIESTFRKEMQGQSSFIGQTKTYEDLLKAVGADKAQDILAATLPNDAQSHLVDHETGTFLYHTEGLAGINGCKDYFGDGCYHGFIAAMVLDRGLSDIRDLVNVCEQDLVSDQQNRCAHGIGHGILDNVGYTNLRSALGLCRSAFANNVNATKYCFDGIFMEGKLGSYAEPTTTASLYYRANDPMYPCNLPDVLAAGAHDRCWISQSQRTLSQDYGGLFDGNIGKVTDYCAAMENSSDQFTCYMGIARQIALSSNNDLSVVRQMCAREGGTRAERCVWETMQVSYQFGDHATPLKVCEAEKDLAGKNGCYSEFYIDIALSYSKVPYRISVCQQISDTKYRGECVAWMATLAAAYY